MSQVGFGDEPARLWESVGVGSSLPVLWPIKGTGSLSKPNATIGMVELGVLGGLPLVSMQTW